MFHLPVPIQRPIAVDVDLSSGSRPKRDGSDDEDDDDDYDNDDVMDTSDKPASSSGTKRPHRQEDNPSTCASGSSPPSKRPKPMCKYGAKCYQKGADHRSKFAHPVLTKEEKEEEKEEEGKSTMSGVGGNVRREGEWVGTEVPTYAIQGEILAGEILTKMHP